MMQGRKLLNYDLQILHGYVSQKGTQRIVVVLQDSEAFDTGLLGELIVLFAWVPDSQSQRTCADLKI